MRWRYEETVLAMCTLAFLATMAARLVISPVVPRITAEFGVSNSVIGLADGDVDGVLLLAVPQRRPR